MIRKSWLGECGSAASVAVVFLFTLALLVSGLHAQTAQSTIAPMVMRPSSPPAFVAAPSFSLGYAPTSVAAGHLTASGNLDLVTADYNSGHISVFRALGQGAFAPGATYAAGAQPRSVTIADINGDGMADVILANESEGTVSVFSGNGDGTLGGRKTYAVGFTPSFIAVGDFSGLGKLDVAVASASGTTLAILQNDGAGGLTKPMNFALSAIPAALTASDLNHDGHLDLVVANATGTVSILLGRGNGQFSALPDIKVASGALSSITVGDFNRDGNDDLVVTASAQNQVAVLLGQGDGKFAPAGFFTVGSSPVATHVADVDGDGIADLIVINKGSNTFSVLSGAGDGTFKSALNFVVGNSPLGLAAGDLYGNGHVDVATIDQLSRTLSIPAAVGDGTFVAGRAYPVGAQPVSVASGDLNGDGKADLVVANYCAADPNCGGGGSVAVLLADAGGVYHVSSTYTMGAGSVSVALFDVNGDKKPDLVALNRVDKTLSLRLGLGDGTFGSLITIPLSAAPIAVASGDFNKDGNTDLAILGDCGGAQCTTPGEVEMLLGSGDGNFRSSGTYTVGYSPVALAVGATRTGAAPDVIVANRCGQDGSCASGGTASILFGDGKGAFTAGSAIALGSSPSSIALANLRGSGVLDLVVSHSTDNTVAVLPGAGNGTFKAAVPYAVGKNPGALAIADFNGDGIPDVAVANTADSTVSVLFGRSDGTLQKSFAVPVSANPAGMAAIAGATKSAPASLATTNGSTGLPQAASNVTVVPNLQHTPLVTGGIVPTISLALTTGNTGTTNVNQSASFTATVTGTTGNGAPTGGTVEFFSDGTAISDCNSSGATGIRVTPGASPSLASTAVCATSVLLASATAHNITAQYLGCPTGGCTATTGDQVYDNSLVSTQTVGQVVNALDPTITVTPSPAGSSSLNTTVTFTAALTNVALTPTPPSGHFTFNLNGSAATCVGGSNVVNVSPTTGQATCQIQNIPVGTTNVVTANYAGDTNFIPTVNPGQSAAYTINAANPTITVTPSPTGPSNLNTPVTFTAALTNVALTPTAPSGHFTFNLNGSAATCVGGSNVVNVNPTTGQATCQIQNMPAGTNNVVTANYAGDTNFVPSTNPGTSAAYTVNALNPTITVSPSPASPSNLNATVTFTASLTGVTLTPVAPSGHFTFNLNGSAATCLGSTNVVNVNASGSAACQIQNMPAGTNNVVTANYAGDTNFVPSTNPGTSAAYTVNALNPTITVSPSPASPSNLNTAVTFTAALTNVTLTPVAPSGHFTFNLNGSAATCVGGSNVVNVSPTTGQATCQIQNMPASTNNIVTANYAGDTNFTPSTNPGTSAAYTTNALVGSLAVVASTTSNPNVSSVPVGTAVTFTVTYTVSPTTPIAPNGTITFTVNGVPNNPCPAKTINGSLQATCAASSLTAGNYVIQASYGGDTNFNPPASPTITLSVGKSSPAVAVISDTPSAVINQQVTFTATVSNTGSGTISPTGNVSFTQGSTPLCTGVGLDTTKTPPQASCPYNFKSPLPAGTLVTATYNGDTNFGVASNTASETVTAATTSLQITSPASGTTAAINQAVTFNTVIKPQFAASSTGAFPQGTVSFTVTNAPTTAPTGTCTNPVAVNADGTVPACTLIFSTASGTTPFHVVAQYNSANPNIFTNSPVSTAVDLTVNSATFSISLLSTPNPSSVNQPMAFSASFSPSHPSPVPVGTVTYKDGSAVLCSVTIDSAGGIPSCPQTFITATSNTVAHNISASFPGDASYNAANSSLTQVVSQNIVTTSVAPTSPSSPTVPVNQPVIFTATVAPTTYGGAGPTVAVPTGTVTFSQTVNGLTTFLCATPQPVSTTAGVTTATCQLAFGTVGLYTISAAYSGDANFVQGTSTTVQESITPPATTVTVMPASSSTTVNQTVTFSVTITPGTTGNTAPTGKVTFTDLSDSKTLICAPVSVTGGPSATAACNITFLNAGKHSIQAAYAGDTNFQANTSTAPAVTVGPSLTVTTLGSSAAASFATQQVTFTAIVAPTPTLGAALQSPSGSVTFGDGTGLIAVACPNPVALAPKGDGTSSASCPVTFNHTTDPTKLIGQLSVTAIYSGDANFSAQATPANFMQTVQDFDIAAVIAPSGPLTSTTSIYLTQGASTSTDLFDSAKISASIQTSTGYSPKTMSLQCEVDFGGQLSKDVTCNQNLVQGVPIASGKGSIQFVFNASSTATVGAYTVKFTASDTNFPSGSYSASFPLYIVAPSGSLSLASGASANEQLQFTTSAAGTKGDTIASYSCPSIWDVINKQPVSNPSTAITCTGPANTATTGDSTQILITIQAGATTTSQNIPTAGKLYAATLFGVPVLALLGWFGSSNSARRNLFRMLSLILLLVGLSYSIGCGASVSKPSVPTPTGIAPGTYQVLVEATGSSGNSYFAEVPLTVVANH